MTAACRRRLTIHTTIETISSEAFDVDQGRPSGDVQMNCKSLKMLSSHCTAFGKSIILALTLLAP